MECSAEDAQQSGFPRPVTPHDRNAIAVIKLEVDAIQNRAVLPPRADERLGEDFTYPTGGSGRALYEIGDLQPQVANDDPGHGAQTQSATYRP